MTAILALEINENPKSDHIIHCSYRSDCDAVSHSNVLINSDLE